MCNVFGYSYFMKVIYYVSLLRLYSACYCTELLLNIGWSSRV